MPKLGIEALKRLKEGNSRFVQGLISIDHMPTIGRLKELSITGQNPFCILLCCSDSRAPAELVFDQGLGDLFVIRVAGNVMASSLMASIELAATMFSTPLLVVMGHTQCGAIQLGVEQIRHPKPYASRFQEDLYNRILPALEKSKSALIACEDSKIPSDLLDQCSADNVQHTLDDILANSSVIKDLIDQKKLLMVGANFNLKTGAVQFSEAAGV